MSKIQLGFYFDQNRCISCNVCTVGCKDWNDVEPGNVTYRKQFTHEVGLQYFPFSMSCNHCEEPACLAECPIGAISKRDDGVVLVDRDKCEGISACIMACPFAKPMFADDKQESTKLASWKIEHPVQKCTMCVEKLDAGEKPICVSGCVGRALDFGDIKELKKQYPKSVRINPKDFPYLYENNTNDTKPSILVNPKKNDSLQVHNSKKYKG